MSSIRSARPSHWRLRASASPVEAHPTCAWGHAIVLQSSPEFRGVLPPSLLTCPVTASTLWAGRGPLFVV
eukprot:15286703-Alexandrium_andersonii.AAC.1